MAATATRGVVLLRVDEVAAALRCSRHSVYRRIGDGSLPALRIGEHGPLRVRTTDVERLLRPVDYAREAGVRLSSALSFSSEQKPSEAEVRRARLAVARRNPKWTELDETALVRRQRWLVHADTDELFTPYRATVFETGSANVAFNDQVSMWFYVDLAGEVVFLEQQSGTWSDIVARRARRNRATS